MAKDGQGENELLFLASNLNLRNPLVLLTKTNVKPTMKREIMTVHVSPEPSLPLSLVAALEELLSITERLKPRLNKKDLIAWQRISAETADVRETLMPSVIRT